MATKFEQRVIELAPQLPPLTDRQEQWMLKQINPDSDSWDNNLYSIMQVIEDCQVFRIFQIYTSAPDNRNGYATKNTVHKCISNIGECYQVWINSKGQRAIYGYNRGGSFSGWARACYAFRRYDTIYERIDGGGYTWHQTPAKMHIKHTFAPTSYNQYYRGSFEYPTTAHKMLCPIDNQYLPEFVRNNGGKTTLPTNCEGDDWVRWMLDTKTERIYKMRPELLTFYVTQVPYKWRNKFFTAIRTAHKHKYIGLEERNLPIWKDHIAACIANGLPMNHPHAVCPPNLIEAHNRMIAERQRREEQERIRRDREMAQARRIADLKKLQEMTETARKYAKRMQKYDGIIISDDKYMIVPCLTMQSMAIEGAEMHHCVFAMKYYEKKESIILLCRDHDGNRVTTIELSLTNGSILQCYAKHDHVHIDDKRIRQLVKDNVHTFLLAGKKTKKIRKPTAEQPTQVALAA